MYRLLAQVCKCSLALSKLFGKQDAETEKASQVEIARIRKEADSALLNEEKASAALQNAVEKEAQSTRVAAERVAERELAQIAREARAAELQAVRDAERALAEQKRNDAKAARDLKESRLVKLLKQSETQLIILSRLRRRHWQTVRL